MADTRTEPTMDPQTRQSAESGKEAAVEKAHEITGEVRHQAGNIAGDVKSQTQHLLSRTKDEIGKEASSRTGQFAATLHEVASELRTMAEADSEGRLNGVASGAADRAERWATQLDNRGFEGVVDDLKSTVRRRPGLILAAAAATGFVVGRLVRDAGQAQGNGSGSRSMTPQESQPSWEAQRSPEHDAPLDDTTIDLTEPTAGRRHV